MPGVVVLVRMPDRSLKVISYGGGVQSTAVLVLAAQGKLDVDAALFANVGDDSERKGTLRYFHEVAEPFAQHHSVALHELHRVRRDGQRETLLGRLHKSGSRSIDITIRVGEDGAPGNRNCTDTFKLKVIARWLRENGATATNPATVYVGISLDEIHRANRRRATPNQTIEYPLLDLSLRRVDCERLILEQPLPSAMVPRLRQVFDTLPGVTRGDLIRHDFQRMPRPPKSACWFCPMRKTSEWLTMRIEDPDEFQRATELEQVLLARRAEIGKDPAYLTRHGAPLADVIPADAQFLPLVLDDDGDCDSGWCMT